MSLKETFFYEDTKMYIEIDCYIFIYKWISVPPRCSSFSLRFRNTLNKNFAKPNVLGFKSALSYSFQVSIIAVLIFFLKDRKIFPFKKS